MTRADHLRRLSAEEVELWRVVTATVQPLGRRKAQVAPELPRHAPEIAPPTEKPTSRAQRPSVIAAKPLTTFDRRERRELARGKLEIDARLDLHGHTLAEAHRRVIDFLIHAQHRGARVALIVTGKGGYRTSAGDYSEREPGVLKRQTPLWLADPRLRHVVAAFGEAAQPHGGSGALYVRLRRNRGIGL